MNRKTLVLSAAIGLLVPVVAGCGGSDGGSGGNSAIVVGSTDELVSAKDAPAPLDPAFAYDKGAWNIQRQVLQTLVTVPRGGGQPVPEAASSCAFTDRQDESYRCTLRSDLTFSNGDPLTVEDVKYSIQRILDIRDPDGAFGLLTNIDTMETNGDQIVFHLKTPDATFPYKLSTPVAGIVDPKQYKPKAERDGFELEGSGPYTFKAKVSDNRIVSATFTRNPDYKGSLKVLNDTVDEKYYADDTTMSKALESGSIDAMLRTISPELVSKLSDNQQKNVNLTQMPGQEIRLLGFNTDAPVVKNRAVRQAIAYLVNRDAITSQVYGSTAEPLYSLIPAGITGHTNSFFDQYGQPSTDMAAQVLRQAGISTPVELTLNYTTDHYGSGTAKEFQILQSQLNASGLFDVTVKGTPWATFLPAMLKGEYPVYGMGWFPDFPDPDNYTAPFLDKDNSFGSPYANTTIRNTLIPQSRAAAKRGDASATFKKIQDITAQDVPMLPLWQANQYIAARDGVNGAEWTMTSGGDVHLWELNKGTV
jgi:peptide/nickel transport system substrate-binding protein